MAILHNLHAQRFACVPLFFFPFLFVFPPFHFVDPDVSHSPCFWIPLWAPFYIPDLSVGLGPGGFESAMTDPPPPPPTPPIFSRSAKKPRLGSCISCHSFIQGADSAKEENTQEFLSGTSSFPLSRRGSLFPTLVEVLFSFRRSVFSQPHLV